MRAIRELRASRMLGEMSAGKFVFVDPGDAEVQWLVLDADSGQASSHAGASISPFSRSVCGPAATTTVASSGTVPCCASYRLRSLAFEIYPGSDLLSSTVTRAVPSAVEGLTAVFDMGTGVTPLPQPRGNATDPLFERLACNVPGSLEGRMIWSAQIRTLVGARKLPPAG